MFAALTFESFVCLALGVFIEQEQFPEGINRKVTLCVFLLVDYGRGKGLLGSLTLKYFFFYCTRGYESIDEACADVVEQTTMSTGARRERSILHTFFLLAIAPDTRQSLLVCSRIPI
jgi:hypothetical protein